MGKEDIGSCAKGQVREFSLSEIAVPSVIASEAAAIQEVLASSGLLHHVRNDGTTTSLLIFH
jgi:hypothetical protein